MCLKLKSLTIWKADINIGIYIAVNGVALNIANDINTNKSDMHSPKGVYQNSTTIYSIVIVLSSNSSYMTK